MEEMNTPVLKQREKYEQFVEEEVDLSCIEFLKSIPVAKMGYHNIFFQRKGKFIVEQLPQAQKTFNIKDFHRFKDLYKPGIDKFIHINKANGLSQTPKNNRKKSKTFEELYEGGFYLNNWINHDDYPCILNIDHKESLFIYELLSLKFGKALDILKFMEKTTAVSTLEYILGRFKVLMDFIEESDDQQLHQLFLGRQVFQIIDEEADGTAVYINIFELNAKQHFLGLTRFRQKAKCLQKNLIFLINFVGKHRTDKYNDYMKLAFKFLSNKINQQLFFNQNENQSNDYFHFLLHLEFSLNDRLNFATKLLQKSKREIFVNELEKSMSNFPCLENLLFYTPSKEEKMGQSTYSLSKQEKIEKICQHYLDKFGDLETIAYLAYEYPFLKKYYFSYKEALQLAFESKEIEKLQNYKRNKDSIELDKSVFDEKHDIRGFQSFFGLLNFQDEKVLEERKAVKLVQVCEVCSKKMMAGEGYLECGKCFHGGHINHMQKWFDQYENCANIDCPCLCN